MRARFGIASAAVLLGLLLLPAAASAQAIGGTVSDETGGVLPGVTVEVRSPALIEQVRSAVTDGAGQYLITGLVSGEYTVTFGLAGFSTVLREGITLSAGFTANVDAQLAVGSVEETITVTGAAPTVDITNVQQNAAIDRDIIDAMAGAMRSMGLYIVLVFFAAQFVSFFAYSGLGQILAVLGADALVALRLDNPLVFGPFILMCCFVNLMLGSASAQWAVTAPIFVPMLMTIGYSPEVIQAAYRIGDSTTNIITPMMSYFGLILAFACRYDRNLGIGTLIATMLPYSLLFLAGWIVFFYVWVFGLGIPVGPAAPTYFEFTTGG